MTILALLDVAEHVGRDELAAAVVAVRVVRLEHAQAVPDGDAGRDDEKAAREASCCCGMTDGVDRLPGDEHRHDGRLAGAGGHLQREADQFGVRVVVGVGEVLRGTFAGLPGWGATSVSQMSVSTASTWQKNGRMLLKLWCRQCWSSRAVSGVTCQSTRIGQAPPRFDVLADLVDDRRRVVLLLLGRDALPVVEHDAAPGDLCASSAWGSA